MKIDEASIDHSALNIISGLVTDSYSIIDEKSDEERGFFLMTLGEIQGVIDLANELKKVLKA